MNKGIAEIYDNDTLLTKCPVCGKEQFTYYKCQSCGKVFCRSCEPSFFKKEEDSDCETVTCSCGNFTLFV